MSSAFYTLVVCFISNVIVYFYCCISIFLIVLIFSICLLVIFFQEVSIEDFNIIYNEGVGFLISKQHYKIQRQLPIEKRKMSSFHKRLSLSGRQEHSFDSGLLSDYESRRSTLKSKNSTSPLRMFNKVERMNGTENFHSKQPFSSTFSNVLSPVRNTVSGEQASPLNHSRRYNSNLKEVKEENVQPRRSFLNEDSSSIHSPNLLARRNNSLSVGGSPGFVSQITATANEMSVHQFPWVSPTVPCIPVRQPPSGSMSSPVSRLNSPLTFSDSNSETPKRNRVRVRLTGPNRSDHSLNGSCLDMSSNLDDSCTTKSVIQVLKEISRKRTYTPTDEQEEHQEAKRRTGHNLYLSRLESEQENPIPSRNTGEDERKRNREPDWDTQSMAGPKRRKKNNHVVNNEIFSSLSSSIGLQFHHSPTVERRKQTVSVGTQVTLLKDNSDKKHNEQGAQTNVSKPVKEVKEAATMPDPPIIPRKRSPVKEKVVTDLNGILKSALSKFKIQPKEASKKAEEAPPSLNTNFSGNPEGTSAGTIPKAIEISTSTPTPPPPFSKQTEQNSALGGQLAFGSQASSFKLPISTPSPITFGSPSAFPQSTSEKIEKPPDEPAKKPDIPNSNLEVENKKQEPKPELSGFTFNSPKETPKIESPFKFGSQPLNIPATSLSAEPSKISPFKAPAVSSNSAASSSVTQPTFSFDSSSGSTASTVIAKPQAPVTPQIPQTVSVVPPASSSETVKNEPFKFGSSGFTFKEKTSVEQNEQRKEETKNSSSTGIFSFGNPEKKPQAKTEETVNLNKPFQFGSGTFTFGQKSNKDTAVSQEKKETSSISTIANAKPVFSFSGSSEKKVEKPGGFAFQLPGSTAPATSEQKPIFSFSATPTSLPATTTASTPISSSSSSISANVKPVFPTSLFTSTSSSGTATGTIAAASPSTVAVSTTPNTNTTFTSGATFGSSNNDSQKSFAPATTSAPPTFGSGPSAFGSGNKAIFGTNSTSAPTSTSLFGSNSVNNPPSGSSIFGSNIGNASSNTSTFPTTTPTFGASGANNSGTVFGNVTTNNNSTFSNPTTTTAASFGSTVTATPTFGATTSAVTSTPAFGTTGTVGSTTPAFGAPIPTTTTAPTFGATSTTTPSFGSIQTTNYKSLFGTPATGTPAPAFGTPAVNNTPIFGSSTAIGTAPTPFGSSNSTPAFGTTNTTAFGASTPAAAPAFGSQPQGFGSQTNSTFGSAPAFGQTSSSTFGAPSTFSNQTSTPAFGASTAFGSSTSTFNATPAPAAPAFGSTSTTFGSTPAFGTQEANKPFTFNAPGSQPQAPGGFNFTAPQPTSTGGSLFQFGASSTSQPSQPFQFNASQPSSTVGGTGPQMFSIGSGSTAPRRVTARRKK